MEIHLKGIYLKSLSPSRRGSIRGVPLRVLLLRGRGVLLDLYGVLPKGVLHRGNIYIPTGR